MAAELDPIQRFYLEQESRPLGSAQRSSNRLDGSFSAASSDAANNLLMKAIRRLENGQEEQAHGFIERALHLPFDEYEAFHPALWSAHMALFIAIGDDLEAADPDDPGWLDRAEALLGAFGPTADAEIRSCLRTLLGDSPTLSARETRRLKALTAGVPFDAEPFASTPDDEPARIEAITALLRTVIEYRKPA